MLDDFFKKIYNNETLAENTKENFDKTKLLYFILGFDESADIEYDGKGYKVSNINIDNIFNDKFKYIMNNKDYKIYMTRISEDSLYIRLE